MKNYIFAAVLVVGVGIAVTYASVSPGPYSLNVHFIPPLVAGECAFAQFWNPPNMTCAMCFCFTGRLSRCVPQPGCNPANATTTTTTTRNPLNPNPNVDATTEVSLVNGTTTTTLAPTPVTPAATNITTPAPTPAGRRRRALRFAKFGPIF